MDTFAFMLGRKKGGAKYNSTGKIYTEHVFVPDEIIRLEANTYAIDGIQSINTNNVTSFLSYCCGNSNSGLKTLICPKLSFLDTYLCRHGVDLVTVQLGSIGCAVTELPTLQWLGSTSGRSSGGFTITIYVDATQLSEIPANVARNPMGGSDAYCTALIYRNSTTGEVLEE